MTFGATLLNGEKYEPNGPKKLDFPGQKKGEAVYFNGEKPATSGKQIKLTPEEYEKYIENKSEIKSNKNSGESLFNIDTTDNNTYWGDNFQKESTNETKHRQLTVEEMQSIEKEMIKIENMIKNLKLEGLNPNTQKPTTVRLKNELEGLNPNNSKPITVLLNNIDKITKNFRQAFENFGM